MLSTSVSLLDRLRGPTLSESAWSDFVELYTPLLHEWARRVGVPPHDAGDLVQEVFVLLLRKLPEFQYTAGPHGSFRGWLRTVLVNKWRELNRRKALPVAGGTDLAEAALADDDVEAFTEREYRQALLRQALVLMQSEFQPGTWRACWGHVVEGRPAADVASELGTTPGAVRVSSSRVLARLRHLLRGLAD